MKRIEYLGDTLNIGRFGDVRKKQVLELFEYEYEGVKDDKRFRLLDPEPSESELAEARKILPLGHVDYDLRTIPWEHPNLFTLLLSRKSKIQLTLMIDAMNGVGAVVDSVTLHDSREKMVDIIVAGAKIMGWPELGQERREELPVFTSGGTNGSTPKKASSKPRVKPRTRKRKTTAPAKKKTTATTTTATRPRRKKKVVVS